MTWAVIASALHLLGLVMGVMTLYLRQRALREPFDDQRRDELLWADNWAGLAALLWIGTGLWRLLGGLDKPTRFYLDSPLFHVKMGLLGLAWACEGWPMVSYIRWRVQLSRGQRPDTRRVPLFRVLNAIEMGVVLVMIFVAAGMARGVGYRPRAPAFCGVRESIVAECLGCHSARTRQAGLDLETDPYAALVGAPSAQWPEVRRVVPGRPEESLLFQKLAGRQGARGLSMPVGKTYDPASLKRVEAWIRDGAARCDR